MPLQAEPRRKIHQAAEHLRDVKTRNNSIRKRYATTEDRARFLLEAWSTQQYRLAAAQMNCLRLFDFDAVAVEWARPPISRLSSFDEEVLLRGVLYARSTLANMASVQEVMRRAQAAGKHSDEVIGEAFEAWLLGRIYAPISQIARLISAPDLPPTVQEDAVYTVSGLVASGTDLGSNPRLRAVSATMERLMEDLPGAVLQACAEQAEPPEKTHAHRQTFENRVRKIITGDGTSRLETQYPDTVASREAEIASPLDLAAEVTTRLEAEERLAMLTPMQRRAFLLDVCEQLSDQEIADETGKSLAAAKDDLRRARGSIKTIGNSRNTS